MKRRHEIKYKLFEDRKEKQKEKEITVRKKFQMQKRKKRVKKVNGKKCCLV